MDISAGELFLGIATLVMTAVLGKPAWQLARAQVHVQRTQHLAEAVAQYLGVPMPHRPGAPVPPPDDDHPSLLDLVKELRDQGAEQATVTAIVAHHIDDGHGAPIPPGLVADFLRHR